MCYHWCLMKILVTGASGHVGSNLVRELVARGEQVRALVHVNRHTVGALDIETVSGDVCNPASLYRAFDGIDTVYHLAACLSLTTGNWREMEPVNIVGTRNVIDACLKTGVKRLVHFSSIHALVSHANDGVIDESSGLMEVSDWPPYGMSKASGEKEVRLAIERGLDAVIVRPTAVLGPFDFQPSFFGEVLILLARGKLPGLVKGGFDWVDVRDVVAGAITAAQKAPAGSDYLLSGHWASFKELAAITSRISGISAPSFMCPLWLAGVGAPFVTAYDRICGRRPLYTSFAIKTLKTSPRVSHEKAARELGYSPRTLAESVRDTLEWFHQMGKLDLVSAPSQDGTR
jgi:dihydroflavonol-4-reductase